MRLKTQQQPRDPRTEQPMRLWTPLAALLALAALPAFAAAQAPYRPGISPITRPAFSPYLNLVRPGAPAGINYYGLVRPEVTFRNSIGTLQNDVDVNRALIPTGGGTGTGTGGLTTGHAATFLNTGGYFLSSTGGLGPTRGAAQTGGVARGGAGAQGVPAPKKK